MIMKRRDFDLLALGEILLRLSPPVNERLTRGEVFQKQAGGAELNVVSVYRSLDSGPVLFPRFRRMTWATSFRTESVSVVSAMTTWFMIRRRIPDWVFTIMNMAHTQKT